MKIITKIDITFDDWIKQCSRFTTGNDVLITRNMPQNTTTSGKAEIIVDINQSLILGFNAQITYRQNYTSTVTNPKLDNNFQSTGENETVTINNYIDVIKYNMKLDFNTINEIIKQVDASNTSTSKGLDRFKENILTAIVSDIVQHKTFKTVDFPDGLDTNNYTIDF